MATLKRFMMFLLVLFRKQQAPRKYAGRDTDLYTFKRTILDRLDWYFHIIKRLKRGDPETYKMYSKWGASIMGGLQMDAIYAPKLDPWWKANQPSFGAFFLSDGQTDKGDLLTPTFMCFRKYKVSRIPPEVQRAKGDIYVVTVCWDDTTKWAQGRPVEFPVALRNGKVTILKTNTTTSQVVKSKKGDFALPQRKFCIDPFFKEWAAQNADRDEASTGDVHEYLKCIFVEVANMYASQNKEMTKIRVAKGSINAVFSIDILRTPYFFKDRDITVTVSGRRKPIFHIVRAHRRLIKGAETFVRTHFRGERIFKWNAYKVAITVPGWHHVDLSAFDLGMEDSPEDTLPEGMRDVSDVAGQFVDWEKEGLGKHKRVRRARMHDAAPIEG